MARNKRDVDRQEKLDAIIAVARTLFLDEGYEATSMAKVAKEAGVAPNTLYWYFADKDALLVAVLNTLLIASISARTDIENTPLMEQLLWLIAQLEQRKPLIITVHSRLEHSEAVRIWHTQFHLLLDNLVVAELLKQGLSHEKAAITAMAGTFIIEGLLSHPHSPQQRTDMMQWLVARTQ